MKKEDYSIDTEALEHYQAYRGKKESGAIAKPVSLGILKDICRNEKPKTILEIGGGMGTITELLLSETDAHVDSYEPDEFCRQHMDQNLLRFSGRYTIVPNYRTLPPRRDYDLIVVDGGTRKGKDGGYTKMIWLFIHYLDNVKTIFVEGNRSLQRIMIRRALKTRFTYTIVRYNPFEYKGEKLPGGTTFRVTREHNRFKRLSNFMYWELKEMRAIKYFFRYRFRKLKEKFVS